ncbi:arginine--tRNA ligase [Candidatus Woesebacteria bacterium RIFCSPHIGHO2_12_FULL_42_9]|uniref:Arginine--tRNA ligase n=2 Tax=Candidatus Woeseibacteriota TaxID=1752722 RepID=A0A1F8AUK5_9BACT|nr:MAG: arginine--tRNA ligase [Candidatus Woesebacteria bacterium GWA1_42_12]OGM55179.1 MAG: arginine--tRNA ligase [Candidatus Woesebacteria bacterium RIFCSPHIGHO2_12_FULL_42_9]
MRDTVVLAIKKATGFGESLLEAPEIEVHGDYSTNVAMVLAKSQAKDPRDLAGELVDKLKRDQELLKIVAKIEMDGPGFINFWLSQEALLENLREVNEKKESYGSSEVGKDKNVVVEYSSPNIAKRFGVGHLRSTVIGQALYNLYRFLGYKVVGDNHTGDWGTQFGTLLYQIDSKRLDAAKLTIDELEDLYVKFNSEAKNDEKLWDEARAYFKKLESGDAKIRDIWKSLVSISQKEFDRIYELLGVKIDNSYGESFYEDEVPNVVEEVRSKGLSKKSEGAEIIEFNNMPPAMLIKSDGTSTYFTRDLATIKFRKGEWEPELIIYEVGSDQTLHFRQVFQTAKLLGWDDKIHYEHVAHGLIRFPHGKMSTRRGETVNLEDVLEEAIARAKGIIDKSETGRGLTSSEKEKVAKSVGIGAVKYFDLTHHPSSDIIFDWEKIFVLEGNSAPYLQYSVARTNSVLQKSGKSTQKIGELKTDKLNSEELSVLRTLPRFSDVIVDSAKNYSPNLLTNYLFDLAQKYNNFYNQHRIIGGENEEMRIALTAGVGVVLKNGLGILGIETPEKM